MYAVLRIYPTGFPIIFQKSAFLTFKVTHPFQAFVGDSCTELPFITIIRKHTPIVSWRLTPSGCTVQRCTVHDNGCSNRAPFTLHPVHCLNCDFKMIKMMNMTKK
jgi:hypothetical protein